MNRTGMAALLACALTQSPLRAAPPRPLAKQTAKPAAPAKPAELPCDSDPLKTGIAAYEDLDYPRCVELLQKALSESLTRAEKIAAYKTLGFCHASLDKPDAARFDFENLLRLDENFELYRRVSPRIRAPVEEAKAAIATGQTIQGAGRDAPYPLPTLTPEILPA